MQKCTKKTIALNKNQFKESLEVELCFVDECPICHIGIDMSQSSVSCYHDYYHEQYPPFYVICIHVCPSCHRSFITRHAIYQNVLAMRDMDRTIFPFDYTIPDNLKDIERISPSFLEIIKEATIAQQNGLNNIYGMALRKSVEHLVKDYALFMNPNDKQKISQHGLKSCIKEYIDDKGIQAIANSCRLIGNNETHWKNKNTKADITLMENFIEALVNYIKMKQTVLDAELYIEKQNQKQ